MTKFCQSPWFHNFAKKISKSNFVSLELLSSQLIYRFDDLEFLKIFMIKSNSDTK